MNIIVTNRIYFAVTKINNIVCGYVFDEFVNYCATENYMNNETDFYPENFK